MYTSAARMTGVLTSDRLITVEANSVNRPSLSDCMMERLCEVVGWFNANSTASAVE